MPRIRPLPRDEVPPDAQAIYDAEQARFGFVLNPTGVMAHRPPILAASKQLNRAFSAGALLPAALTSLVCVRVATLVGCPF
jgi:hypothetical protein